MKNAFHQKLAGLMEVSILLNQSLSRLCCLLCKGMKKKKHGCLQGFDVLVPTVLQCLQTG